MVFRALTRSRFPQAVSHKVRRTFNHPELACPLVNEDTDYRNLEGARTVGTLRVLSDAWQKIDDIVRVGAVLQPPLIALTGRRRRCGCLAEPPPVSDLRQVGWQPWAEIGDRLQVGTS